MNITYGITKEIYSIGKYRRVSYGIAAYANAKEHGTTNIIAAVHDVTADRRSLTRLVALCNRLDVSSLHLSDVVADFLAT